MKRALRIGTGWLALLGSATCLSLRPFPDSPFRLGDPAKVQILDRHGQPLTVTYRNAWNFSDYRELPRLPDFLKRAFVLAEDKRFFEHGGVDWRARLSAVAQLFQGVRRGASTITEQVVRLLHPRSRNPWSRWVEGFEALALERLATKGEILEFYLNQVPYGGNRRGVAQAARYYFDRDLETLTRREMVALVTLVQGPTAYDPRAHPARFEAAVERLSRRLSRAGLLNDDEVRKEPLELARPRLPVEAPHFASFVLEALGPAFASPAVRTTLDATLQSRAQGLLDGQLARWNGRNVRNGAALVVDHGTGEILAWVVAGNGRPGLESAYLDPIRSPRQPGSALKPFLYGLALESGWTAATLVDDSPIAGAVGDGMHAYRNYSRAYYGPLPLRDALGNSLNTPAIRAIQFVGVARYLERLHALGFDGLGLPPEHYGEGLALGNGEVTPLELARAYTALANRGCLQRLRFRMEDPSISPCRPVYGEDVASLLGNILSDPWARSREFGRSSVLDLPVQTATKTGTSTDYRDAWAVGYNHRHVVVVWMGNLTGAPTDGMTGSLGPATVLRSLFAELTRHRATEPLYLSPRLVRRDLCTEGNRVFPADGVCPSRTEWFVPGTVLPGEPPEKPPRITQPVPGLVIAIDPRIPRARQAFEFKVEGKAPDEEVLWALNGVPLARSRGPSLIWPLARGSHELSAVVRSPDGSRRLEAVPFLVK